MKYKLLLNNGMSFNIESNDIIASDLGQKLNNDSITFFSLGNMMLNKQDVTYIHAIEVESDAPAYNIYLRNGESLNTHSEDYNAGDLSEVLNDRRKMFAVIGDTIVTKNFISLVVPA